MRQIQRSDLDMLVTRKPRKLAQSPSVPTPQFHNIVKMLYMSISAIASQNSRTFTNHLTRSHAAASIV